jgi:DNA invertase Pin-like site-specific DNA recombinase
MRVGNYLRVSTDAQTVENQRLDLERVAAQRGWEVVETYIDKGISGAKGRDKRPAFDKLCKDAAQGKLDVIAAWSIDRIGRSLAHVASFMVELQAQNVALYLYQQQVDGTTPAGQALFGMAAVFAQFERAMLIERINAGLARAKKQGKRLGRPTSVTAQIKTDIHALRSKKRSIRAIAKELQIGVSIVQRTLAA